MSDQRRFERRPFPEPVNICTETRKDRVGIVRDVSAMGLRLNSRSRFAIGERVDLTFHVSDSRLLSATGRVVRAPDRPDFSCVFPYVTAVVFDTAQTDLAA